MHFVKTVAALAAALLMPLAAPSHAADKAFARRRQAGTDHDPDPVDAVVAGVHEPRRAL